MGIFHTLADFRSTTSIINEIKKVFFPLFFFIKVQEWERKERKLIILK